MKINREILRLALPAIVSNITVPLLGLCDTTIAGHLGSSTPIGAIAMGSMMCNAIFWLFGFLRMGTTGLTAQAFGEARREKCAGVLSRSLFLALVIGVLLALFRKHLCTLFIMLMGPEQDVKPLVEAYFLTVIMSAPALLATMSVSGWLVGMQNTSRPMVIAIAVNIINIVGSILAVFVFKVGFKGIALGTFIANWIGLFIALWLAKRLTRRFGWQKMGISVRHMFAGEGFGRFFSVNTDIFFRSFCVTGVSFSLTAFGASMGTLTLAANAVIIQFFNLFSFFMDGFAFAGEALSGRFAGAHDAYMLKKSVRYLLLWSAGCALAFTLIYICGSKPIVALITNDQEVIGHVLDYKLWLVMIPAATVCAFIFDGIFIGLTATRRMLVSTFTAAVAFFAISLLHRGGVGITDNNDVLWAAFLTYLFLRGALLAAQTPKLLSKSSKLTSYS